MLETFVPYCNTHTEAADKIVQTVPACGIIVSPFTDLSNGISGVCTGLGLANLSEPKGS